MCTISEYINEWLGRYGYSMMIVRVLVYAHIFCYWVEMNNNMVSYSVMINNIFDYK